MPQYPTRISAFKRWANLKVQSGQVGLGDKQSSSQKTRRRRRLQRFLRRKRKKRMEE